MKTLAKVFSSHRHVGESEAYYKICPELHLTHSSIKHTYVDTSFPENRRYFLKRYDFDEEDCEEEGD